MKYETASTKMVSSENRRVKYDAQLKYSAKKPSTNATVENQNAKPGPCCSEKFAIMPSDPNTEHPKTTIFFSEKKGSSLSAKKNATTPKIKSIPKNTAKSETSIPARGSVFPTGNILCIMVGWRNMAQKKVIPKTMSKRSLLTIFSMCS